MSRTLLTMAGPTRRAFLTGLAATAASGLVAAPAIARGAGNFRSVNLVNKRTGEWLNTVYWVEGAYIPEALDGINHILRDWRQDLTMKMDARTVDIIAATHKLLDCVDPVEVISGYRSPTTNKLLRSRSRGVASNSYHMKGMAVDLTLQSRTVAQISRAALTLKAGGVGKYSRSDFVHVDCGPVRDWGR